MSSGINKVVIITGASRGLGLVTAQEFLVAGWSVVGTGRSSRPSELPESVEYHQFDASDANACAQFWKAVSSQYTTQSICLVNNAGGYVGGALVDAKSEDYELQMRSCYFPGVYMTQGLVRSYQHARVINIISTGALAPSKGNSAYGAAKAAASQFFRSIQLEYKPEQYRITNIYPHNIATAGPNPQAINPTDLARFVREQAELTTSYYLRDITLYETGEVV